MTLSTEFRRQAQADRARTLGEQLRILLAVECSWCHELILDGPDDLFWERIRAARLGYRLICRACAETQSVAREMEP